MGTKAKIWPRRLARQMAKARLDKMGATGYNKEPIVLVNGRPTKTRSRFARSWQELATQAMAEAMAREAARRKKAVSV